MTRGPERLRLDAALAEADEAVVQSNGEAEWLSATTRLRDVSRALRAVATWLSAVSVSFMATRTVR